MFDDTKTTIKFALIFGLLSVIFFDVTLSLGQCQEKQESLNIFSEQNPGVLDSPGGYRPRCNENGEFMAMQSNENFFFCVSTRTGDIIPNTEGTSRFISQNVCQQYSALWSEFLTWYKENSSAESDEIENAHVTEESCGDGFEYRSCDCPRNCVPGRNMTEVEMTCSSCKPVCSCPTGFYQYNGECVSVNRCLNLDPEEMMNSMWNDYLETHGAELIQQTMVPLEEENEESYSAFEEAHHENEPIEEENLEENLSSVTASNFTDEVAPTDVTPTHNIASIDDDREENQDLRGKYIADVINNRRIDAVVKIAENEFDILSSNRNERLSKLHKLPRLFNGRYRSSKVKKHLA